MCDNIFFVLAFILGILIIAYSFLMFLLPKKNSYLFIKLLFDLTYIAQLLLIFFATKSYGVFAGIAANSVGAIRDVVYMKDDNKEHRMYWNFFLCALIIFLLHFSYSSPISYLPVIGTVINTTALSLKEKKNVCALTIFGQFFFISYYVLLLKESDFLTILNIISALTLLVSAIVGLVLSLRKIKLSTKKA